MAFGKKEPQSIGPKDVGDATAILSGGMVPAAQAGELITAGDQLPEYLRGMQGDQRGRENVTADDLVIPRLELVQDISPARKKTDPAYIPGAEEGMLFNNVTRELYGTQIVLVPVLFRKEWLLWKDRKLGGGFRGAFASEQDAEAARADLVNQDPPEKPDDFEVVDTGQQFCLLIKPDGSIEEIVVSMSKSKAKISRKWNSLIRLTNGPSFGRVYKIGTAQETNKANQTYWNLTVAAAGYPSEALFRRAEKTHASMKQARASQDFDEPADPAPSETEY